MKLVCKLMRIIYGNETDEYSNQYNNSSDLIGTDIRH